jgi:heme exporter protein D
MRSWDEFLTMGGYAAYVWPAYGIAAVVVILNAVLPLRRLHRQLKSIRVRSGKP